MRYTYDNSADERAQSAAAAGARAVGTAVGGGDGRPLAAGAAARQRAISISSAAISGRRSPPKTSRATKRRSRSTRATRRCTTMSRCCISSWAGATARSRTSPTSKALKPQSAAAHYNLGTALTVARRLDDAAAEYREALAARSGLRQRPQQPRQRPAGAEAVRPGDPRVRRKWCGCSRIPSAARKNLAAAYSAAGRQPPR